MTVRWNVAALGAVFMLVMAACVAPVAPVAPPAVQPVITRPPAPEPTPTAVIDVPPSEVKPPASSGQSDIAALAVQFVSAELGVDPAIVQVVSAEPVDWRNSCLGVEIPGEMCLEAITPGWRVVLEIGGQQVYVHTNQSGSVLRLANDSQVPPAVKPASTPWEPADIYAAVVRQLYTVDHTFGEPPLFPVVYVLRQTDDSAGAPGAAGNSQTVFPGDQERIVALLADLPARIVWVDSQQDVPRDANGAVAEGGALITLGNIAVQADGSLHVPASIYMGMLAAGGQTYVLQAIDGVWQITGVAGPVWMS